MFFPKILLTTCLVGFALISTAQTKVDSSHWNMSIGIGYYFPSNTTASYYNGQDNNRLQFLLQGQQKPQIMESLGNYEYELAEYALDMVYNNAASFELELGYYFGKNWNISVYFRNVTVSAAGIFTLRVQRQNQNNTLDPYLEPSNISGRERRSHLALGAGKRFYLNKSNFFIPAEAGVDFNFTEVLENKVEIAGNTYTLPTFNNIQTQQANNPITVGSGFFISTGIGYKFPSQYGFIIKGTYIRSNINVNDVVSGNSPVFLASLNFSRTF